jgi:ADP-ribosylglycohydrolase
MNIKNALLSLDGLSVGDAFGERFFVAEPETRIRSRQIPGGLWEWTDDTHMALSIVEELLERGRIDPDGLMKRFSTHYIHDSGRGYGSGAKRLLERVYFGEDWRVINKEIFRGGSYGNGAAMRAAPLGGYFSGDLQRTVQEARLSAEVTHAHPEGIAGAVAVAVAACIASQPQFPQGLKFLKLVLEFVPDGKTKDGIDRSLEIPPEANISEVVGKLGNGDNISAQDTVPFCLWCAAHHLGDYEEALWRTVSGMGDRDTTCAIVGGIVALSAGSVPQDWLKHREPLSLDSLRFTNQ